MKNAITDLICQSTAAESAAPVEVIQRLWSGYGQIVRYRLRGAGLGSVIVKHVKPPSGHQQTQSLSHRRKLRSYQVETAWYGHWSMQCGSACRVPVCLAFQTLDDEVVMVLEDLDAAGFAQRRSHLQAHELDACLHWLADFHATFMGVKPKHLWATGTYWHLATRPDELQALQDKALKNAAAAIDRALRDCRYQTLVHGDAKLANFCFSQDGGNVAAVDFQYVGGGCGIKDVAYFLDSCLDGEQCQRQESHWLDCYFQALKHALHNKQANIDADAVEQEWRNLYPVAWTDFHRFLKGWSPGHWPADSYSERLARQVIAQLQPEYSP